VNVPNPDHLLKPGAFARAQIQTFTEPNVLFVPERAVVSFAGTKKVYAVNGQKAVEIPIETGVQTGGWVEVTKSKNLKPGTPIVIEGISRASSGAPVIVR
jgi:multidrug efflux pump subunit AcrA (membrane-fusion protein)